MSEALGTGVVWEPEHYIRGNYFQNEVSNTFRKNFVVEPFGKILDVGCGDGQYTSLLAETMKHGQILGIDSSSAMIEHAQQHWANKHIQFAVHRIEEFHESLTYDFALSFWCLHWTNIELSFSNIFHALKNGGRMYAVFSSFTDNSIMQTWQVLAQQNRHQILTDRYNNSREQCNTWFYYVMNLINQLPFKQVKLNLKTTTVYFPSIDYFKNLVLTMPFMNTLSPEIIDDVLEAFREICHQKYGGQLYYETRPVFLEALK